MAFIVNLYIFLWLIMPIFAGICFLVLYIKAFIEVFIKGKNKW